MLSVNSNVQQQNTPTFGGNKKIIGEYGKTFLEREVLRTPNNRNPHSYISSPLYHIKNWFKERMFMIRHGYSTKSLIEFNPLKKDTISCQEQYAKGCLEDLEKFAKEQLKKQPK